MIHYLIAVAAFFLIFPVMAELSHASETRGLRVVARDTASGQIGEVKLYNKSYAVIIGIDRYKNLSADRQLKNAVKDARGIEATSRQMLGVSTICLAMYGSGVRTGMEGATLQAG